MPIHRRKNRRSLPKALGETALVLLLLGVASGMWMGRQAHRTGGLPTPAQNHASPFEITGPVTMPPAPAPAGSIHRVYGHSLVAGGVHSVAELIAVMKNDSLLAEHYKNIDLSKAHIITLDHDAVAYVSYRRGHRIYWQGRATVIAKGEEVITDGVNFVRTRCGNQIAYDRGFPTSPSEPKDMDSVIMVTFTQPAYSAGSQPDYENGPSGNSDEAATSAGQNIPGSAVGSAGPLPPGESSAPLPPWVLGGGSVGGNGGGSPPLSPLPPPSNTPGQFSADEFSSISVSFGGHSGSVPKEALVLLAGIFLVVGIHFVFRR